MSRAVAPRVMTGWRDRGLADEGKQLADLLLADAAGLQRREIPIGRSRTSVMRIWLLRPHGIEASDPTHPARTWFFASSWLVRDRSGSRVGHA